MLMSHQYHLLEKLAKHLIWAYVVIFTQFLWNRYNGVMYNIYSLQKWIEKPRRKKQILLKQFSFYQSFINFILILI